MLLKETKKLFDHDAYAEQFEAVVLHVREISAQGTKNVPNTKDSKKDSRIKGRETAAGTAAEGIITGKTAEEKAVKKEALQEKSVKEKNVLLELVLDQTLFFPEEGGQTPDTGTLDGYPVVDVQLESGVIRHLVRIPAACQPESVFAPGRTVTGRIDFAHRFSNMQNHSGEHILSGLVHGKFGYDNVGFHLSDNTVTLDFNGPLTDEDLIWLEDRANRIVWDNREIRAFYPPETELESIEYRSKKEIDGPLRLVEIQGVDMCACCAPHVKRTGEIGIIKIIRTLRERGGIRLTILCGSRALAFLQTLQKAAEDVSHLTNMPREEIAAGTSRILEENERLRQRGAALEDQLVQALAASVPADQENVFLFLESGKPDACCIGNLARRRLVNTLCAAHPGCCGVFAGSDETGYQYIIGAAEDRDARVLNACLQKACGARGGGKAAMVQGSVKASEQEIRAALA